MSAEQHRLIEDPTAELAAAASDIANGDREPRIPGTVLGEQLAGQRLADLSRLFGRIEPARRDGRLGPDQAASFETRLRELGGQELGAELIDEELRHLPDRADFEALLEQIMRRHRIAPRDILPPEKWEDYYLTDGRMTGRMIVMEPIPTTRNSKEGRRYPIIRGELLKIWTSPDGNIYPIVRVTSIRESAGHTLALVECLDTDGWSQTQVALVDGMPLEKLHGRPIEAVYEFAGYRDPEHWTGRLQIDGQTRTLLDGSFVDAIEGSPITSTRKIVPTSTGALSGLVRFADPDTFERDYDYPVYQGRTLRDDDYESLLVKRGQTHCFLFHHGTYSGTLTRRHSGREIPVIFGERIEEIDGERVTYFDLPHVVYGEINGRVQVGDRRVPLVNGHLMHEFQGMEIVDCAQVRNYHGQLNGLLYLTNERLPYFVLNGERIAEIDGKNIFPGRGLGMTEIRNVADTFNGRVNISVGTAKNGDPIMETRDVLLGHLMEKK